MAKSSPINPVLGGGALKVGDGGNGSCKGGSKDGVPTQRARATGIKVLYSRPITIFVVLLSMLSVQWSHSSMHPNYCIEVKWTSFIIV